MMRKNKETGITPQENKGMARKGVDDSPLAWFRDVDRWFDDLRRDFDERWVDWPRSRTSLGNGEAVREPTIDLQDKGAEFLVTAEIPGVSKDDVEIRATPNSLEIRAETRGQQETKDETYVFRERSYSAYYRSLPMPDEVVPEAIAATMKDGTLEVRLPKKELTPPPKSVTVKVD